MPAGVECSWTGTDTPAARDLESADGVWLLPGTPYRDDATAYAAIEHCRVSGTPFLGTCGGFQYACAGWSSRSRHAPGADLRRSAVRWLPLVRVRPRSGRRGAAPGGWRRAIGAGPGCGCRGDRACRPPLLRGYRVSAPGWQ